MELGRKKHAEDSLHNKTNVYGESEPGDAGKDGKFLQLLSGTLSCLEKIKIAPGTAFLAKNCVINFIPV